MQNPFPTLLSNDNIHIIAIFGIVYVVYFLRDLIKVIAWFLKTYSCIYYRPYNYINKYGNWAVVTGCTGGIGRALAIEISKRGVNVVLVSRNVSKLQTLAKQIEDEYKVQTKIIINEATDRISAEQMAEELSGMDIGILINNVGLNSEDSIMSFEEISINRVSNMLSVNCGHGLIAMKYVLPNMISARKGLIVNICSTTSYFPVPLQAHYSGTKIYMSMLSQSIALELQSTGVQVQSVCPLLVQSDMTSFSNIVDTYMCISSESYAKSSVNLFGKRKKIAGHWLFDCLMAWYITCLNQAILMRLIYIFSSIFRKYNL